MPGQSPQLSLCAREVAGLANRLAVYRRDLIRADHHAAGVLAGYGHGFCHG
ncbi:hypothetical protein D555_2318 [Bordetella holmesii 35009]|nr:hypothetical protein D555_2318 [Bordetella holmesii 35009]